MFNIVMCEMKKFKRIWILLISGVFVLIQVSSAPINMATIKGADDLFTWVNMMVFSCGFLAAINILTAYVFLEEYKNNTMVTMITYKYGRWKIFLGKIFTIILISLLLYIIEFTMVILMSFISFKSTLTLAVITKHLILTAKAFIFQLLMITVTACIALASKDFVAPIMYVGIQLIASFVFLSYPPVRAYIPFPLPVVSNLMLIRDNYNIIRDISIMPSAVIIAVIMFIGGLIYGCWYINRMDVS